MKATEVFYKEGNLILTLFGNALINNDETCQKLKITKKSVHYHTTNARDEFFYFFISRRCYIGNNFTQKIDVEILLTCNQ
jgi:hypothetical protein